MTSANVNGPVRLVTTAPAGTPCGWTAYGETGRKLTCQGDRDAVHILTATLPVAVEGTALCGYHSPYDVTEAERVALGQPFRTKGEAGAEILAARAAEVAEAEVSGIDTLRTPVTLDTSEVSAVRTPDQLARFHRLSAPMIGVLSAVAEVRGLVSAWAMRNVVVKGVKGATMRTVTALITRGILADEVNDGNQSGTGGFHDYVLTDRGREVAAALGVLAAELPQDIDGACALAARHTSADCETGCEVIIARGAVMLPAGGDVCVGCGSIFTRPNGQINPALDLVSAAVVARNNLNGGI